VAIIDTIPSDLQSTLLYKLRQQVKHTLQLKVQISLFHFKNKTIISILRNRTLALPEPTATQFTNSRSN